MLDPEADADLLASHMTFLPKLQQQLDSFQLGWCHHCLRTEQSMTPHQLWLLGMHDQDQESLVIDGLNDVSHTEVVDCKFTCSHLNFTK